ncbi:MAG: flagellar hook-basal body protein [Tissierellaceae bacterium]
MIRSVFTVNRNMNVLQKKLENTGANMSNINTPGYKFQDIVQSTLESRNIVNHMGSNDLNKRQELGSLTFGNQIDEVYSVFQQGNQSDTGRNMDFAIVDNGFFAIQMDNGEIGFTRNGNFKLDSDNRLVTMEGYPVLGVDDFGNVVDIYAYDNHMDVNVKGDIVGQDTRFYIVDFEDYSQLNPVGDTIFTSEGGNYPVMDTNIRQGFLEMSNVNIIDEMVKMIEISREFEANQKLLHAADETLSKAVNEIGR